jgi:TRAP-type C4-dicarboxylate transport system, small permease component
MITALKLLAAALNRVSEIVTAVMMFVMTTTILFQVICRFLGFGFDWLEELARYLLICIVMLGTGIGVYRGGNIGIEAVINAVSPAWRRRLTIVMHLCCLLLFGEMIRYGWAVVTIVKRQISPSMQISMAIPYGVIFAAAIIIFLHTFVLLLDQLYKKPDATSGSEA